MKQSFIAALLLITSVALLTACGESTATLPAYTDTAVATSTLRPIATNTSIRTATNTSTLVPQSTDTVTPIPFATVIVPVDGLVADYPFNGNTNDESGNGNHGVNNGAAFVADRFGNPKSAVHFTGQEYIEVRNTYDLNLVNDFSIVIWIKPEKANPNTSSQYSSLTYYVIGKSDSWSSLFDGQTGHSGWKLLYDTGSYINTRPDEHPIMLEYIDPEADENSNRKGYLSNAVFPFDEWGCFVVTYDDYVNTLSFYKNGLLETEFTGTYLDFRTNAQNLYIGNNGYPARPFTGVVDDIAIYARALSASEVGALCGVFVDLSTPTATATKKPTSTPLPSATPLCTPGLTRLQVGDYAIVSPGDPNRVRSEPRKGDNLIGTLEAGTIVKILEGPVCADGLVYWKVESDIIPGGVGWTAEGDGTNYWLDPYAP